jgi:hypothetical protein
VRLQSFAEFWKHDAPNLPCCLLATDEDLDINQGDDCYDCGLCPVADQISDLHADRANTEAWDLWRRTMSRFTFDTHTAGLVLAHLESDVTAQTFPELVERFAIIYDALYPPPEQKKEVHGA